ncbi:hypothetical protein JCM19239_4659 [Vibrio variabilis]|uniref:Uncharacterized protein n=1 Tax=Vibrio variabilis TaxID=990271 RepID=A0ABQ0J837_9VIBR|nr:hypothetical protein JCM19239_4659 [Vibrio variabilis]
MVTRQLTRVVNDIPAEIANDSQHSKWLLEQGYEPHSLDLCLITVSL